MPSLLRQETQLAPSDTYNDAVAAGATMESAPVSIEDDLNTLRSQILRYAGETNWYDTISGRTTKQLGTDLTDLEAKRFLFRTQVLTDVVVTAAQNWEVLSVVGNEAPSETAAVGAVTTLGAVVAQHTGSFGTAHALDEVAGPNAIRPKNLMVVRDAATGQPLQSGGKDIWALLQSESAVDGHTFDDATNQVQLSFVIENGTGDDLIACPVVDIAGETINYSYVQRINLDGIPESAFLNGVFVDQSASVDVTLDNAIDNQSGAATQAQNIDIDQSAGIEWFWRDAASADVFGIKEGSGGGTTEVQIAAAVDVFNVDAAVNNFAEGIAADSGGTLLNLGVTAGQIDSAGALKLLSQAAADITLEAANEIVLTDVNQPVSYASNLKLSENATSWTDYETAFGEVSLMDAIVAASTTGSLRVRAFATVQNGPHAAGANITGAGATPPLDTQFGDLSAMTFVTEVDIYVNGQLQVNAAGATEDAYPGTSLANGDFKLTRKLKDGDKIIMVTWG